MNKKVLFINNKKTFLAIMLCISMCICIIGCDNKENPFGAYKEETREIFAMDTYMTLKAYGSNADKALDRAEEEIKKLDDMFSVGNSDSEVCKLNSDKTWKLSDEARYILKESMDLYELTDGSFNIAVYPLMEEWGFTDKNFKVPDEEIIEGLLEYMDVSEIIINDNGEASLPEGMKVDFGGIVKGYTSNRIMEIFKEYNVSCGMVSLGGNVQTYNKKQDGSDWVIAIEDPEKNGNYLGTLKLSDKAVITSGGYERYFEQDGEIYHHIIDPKNGYPARSGITSITVVSKNGTLADGLSTALFIMGKDKALDFWKEYGEKKAFDLVIYEDDGDITVTKGIKDCFSSDYEYDVFEK